jgi:hypothetical protein
MNRTFAGLLKGLLCAMLFTLPGLPAWAMARSETRVGGSPVFLAVLAAQESAKTLAPPSENPGYGYDFAPGGYKYLYCQGNPIDGIGPNANPAKVKK